MAAGKGSRLGELTNGNPKSFVEIKGKKLIEYNLQLLNKYGIEKIVIVTGYRSEAFEELTREMENVHLIYNTFYEMLNVLGSFFMGMEAIDEDFIYLHADTLCDPFIFEKLVHLEGDVILPIDYKQCDEEAMKVRSENGRIVEITKQMPLELAEGEFIGMCAFRIEVLPVLKSKVKQLMKEKAFSSYFEGAIQRLIDEECFDIRLVSTEGYFWSEIDFLEDFERAVANISDSLLTLKV